MPHLRARPGKDDRPDRPRTWEIVCDLPPGPGGKRRRETETFHGTKSGAEERMRARQAEIDRAGATYVAPSRQTVEQYMVAWLRTKAPDIRPTTLQSYDGLVRVHIVPALGAVPLADLTPARIQAMVDALRGKRSARTAAFVRAVLRNALEDAVRLGELTTNPVDRTRGPRQAARRVRAFTMAEVDAMAAVARDVGWPTLADLLLVAAYTGLRRGELLGLQWGDVDLATGRVVVRRALVLVRGVAMISEPKTQAGARSFILPGTAVRLLRRRKSAIADSGGERDGEAAWVWVFTNRAGGHLEPRNIDRDFYKVRDLAGVSKLPFHSLRHTAASVQIAAGVPLTVVSKRLGHSSIRTTADTYGDLLQEADADAAAKLDQFLGVSAGHQEP